MRLEEKWQKLGRGERTDRWEGGGGGEVERGRHKDGSGGRERDEGEG